MGAEWTARFTERRIAASRAELAEQAELLGKQLAEIEAEAARSPRPAR
ncbi:hypothetical protein ABIA33_007158 [Streptacidiphilus sp. MAP12-16]